MSAAPLPRDHAGARSTGGGEFSAPARFRARAPERLDHGVAPGLGPSRRALLAAGACALATGCASPPRPASATAGPPAWRAGRLALRVAETPGRAAQSLTAAFELAGDAERGELRLATALGTQLAAARWSPGQAWLRTSEGERRYADLDALSREALGEVLPLAALPSWVAGTPWPAAPHEPEAQGFRQLGWRIGLAARAEGRIEILREAAGAGPEVLLRLRLDDTAAAGAEPPR